MSVTRQARVLLVYESWFGNTAAVAEAVSSGMSGEGMRVECVEVSRAPREAVDCDVVVVGAPTHAFGLSRPSTREDAVRRGAAPTGTSFGVREWLDQLPAGGHGRTCAAAFDTRAEKARRIPFAAAVRHIAVSAGTGITSSRVPPASW